MYKLTRSHITDITDINHVHQHPALTQPIRIPPPRLLSVRGLKHQIHGDHRIHSREIPHRYHHRHSSALHPATPAYIPFRIHHTAKYTTLPHHVKTALPHTPHRSTARQ